MTHAPIEGGLILTMVSWKDLRERPSFTCHQEQNENKAWLMNLPNANEPFTRTVRLNTWVNDITSPGTTDI
ncbi:unnamed protein product [Fusarium graminearum]|nr:unnamed protein product [Fusarium graminearum]CAG1972050.1 unnamed protein product [Fusarium graminearum]